MMKKLLLIALSLAGLSSVAQNDVAVTTTSPAASSTLGPGISFDFDVTITNAGSVDITTSDTVYYYPVINGQNYLQDTAGQRIGFGFTGVAIAANGGTETRSHSFGGLNLSSAPNQFDFCAIVSVRGANWTGVTESDTVNNLSCNTVNYDDGGTVGITENSAFVKMDAPVVDNSFYANGRYNLDITNLNNGTAEIRVVNIIGQSVLTTEKQVNNRELKGDVELGELGRGIYIISIGVDGQAIDARKIMVQ